MTGERVALVLSCELHRSLGAELLDPDEPSAGVRFPVRGLARTPMGTLHAAALGAAVELAAYLAVLPTLSPAEHVVTHAIAFQMLRGGRSEDVVEVTGRLGRRSRHVAFLSVTATIDDLCIAEAQVTKSIVTRE